MSPTNPSSHGRVLAKSPGSITLQNEHGVASFAVASSDDVGIGDIVRIVQGRPIVLTRATRAQSSFRARTLHPRRLHAMDVRSRVEHRVREFFGTRGFRETHTPLLVPSPGMETHIRPFCVTSAGKSDGLSYLPTSPEFAMKRLLVGGLEKIFQICPAFRAEPHSITHHPEFTMLEWYRAYAGYEDIMRDTEELVSSLATAFFGRPVIRYQGVEISVAPPWPRLTVRGLFRDLGIDLSGVDLPALADHCQGLGVSISPSDTWDDLFFRIWLSCVEPRLPADRAVFVTRYPSSQAALAIVDQDPDGTSWARRFEVFTGGLELGNAFDELTCPVEQRRRFERDMELRAAVYGPSFPKTPIDESFLAALEEGMPPAGGIAMGLDRLVMLFADEPELEYTLWLPSGATL